MSLFEDQQPIGQLEKRKGGYFYLVIPAEAVSTFPQQRKTRLLCTLDEQLTFQCGLNHLGDGNFFVIVASRNLKAIGKALGDQVAFRLAEDPNPLGVDMPEVLEVVLAQDPALKEIFDGLSLGKQRNVIHSVNKIKDLDRQVQRIIEIIQQSKLPRPRRKE